MKNLSKIQKKILSKLLKTKGLRYSRIKPKGVESDLFYYHLMFLKKKGFIEKVDNLYKLTDSGKSLVTNLDKTGNITNVFKVGVFLLIERQVDGKRKILMHTRGRQPYYGDVLPPSGTAKPGEFLDDVVARKIKEETTLSARLKNIGMARFIFYKEKQLVEDITMHLFYAEKFEGEIEKENEFGKFYWSSYGEAIEAQKDNKTKITSVAKILKRLEKQDFGTMLFEEKIQLESI